MILGTTTANHAYTSAWGNAYMVFGRYQHSWPFSFDDSDDSEMRFFPVLHIISYTSFYLPIESLRPAQKSALELARSAAVLSSMTYLPPAVVFLCSAAQSSPPGHCLLNRVKLARVVASYAVFCWIVGAAAHLRSVGRSWLRALAGIVGKAS